MSLLRPSREPVARVRTKTAFYIALSIFMAAMVLAGFWPSYCGPLLRGDTNRPLIVHIHGVVFLGWMALMIVRDLHG